MSNIFFAAICWIITGRIEEAAGLLCFGSLQPVLGIPKNRLPKRDPVLGGKPSRVLRTAVVGYSNETPLEKRKHPKGGHIIAEVFRGTPNATFINRAVKKAHIQVNLEKIFRRIKKLDVEELTQATNRIIAEIILGKKGKTCFPGKTG